MTVYRRLRIHLAADLTDGERLAATTPQWQEPEYDDEGYVLGWAGSASSATWRADVNGAEIEEAA